MVINFFENIIYNNKCKICNENFFFTIQNLFCDNCLSKIKKENIIYCKTCGKKTNLCLECRKSKLFDEVKIFTTYSKVFQELIKYYKFYSYKNLSLYFSDLIKEDIKEFVNKNKIDFILTVPSSKSKNKERGFDHLKEIITQIFPNFLISNDLVKIKETPLQVQLNKKEREKNLEGVFRLLNKDLYKGKNILIFDDILTTGSTIKEIYKTVKIANPKGVYCYIIAT